MSSKNIIQKRSFVNFAMASTKGYHNPHLKAKPKTRYLFRTPLRNRYTLVHWNGYYQGLAFVN